MPRETDIAFGRQHAILSSVALRRYINARARDLEVGVSLFMYMRPADIRDDNTLSMARGVLEAEIVFDILLGLIHRYRARGVGIPHALTVLNEDFVRLMHLFNTALYRTRAVRVGMNGSQELPDLADETIIIIAELYRLGEIPPPV